jgi:sugar phosphate isomerase/epimerase
MRKTENTNSKMRKLLISLAALLLIGACAKAQQQPEAKFGWKLGAQTYTFKEFTFYEAINKIDSCGLKNLECYTAMVIGGGLEGKMDFRMDASKRDQIRSWLKKKGMKLTGYGVVKLKEEADWKALFEFGKAMGIETFTAEPEEKFMPLLSTLCDKYKINVAIHNHAEPTHYWKPEVVLAAIKGQSKRIGACADVGHWIRSGLDPVECLRQLNGHVLWVHMKDMSDKTKEAHSVIWGTGVLNMQDVVLELKKQKFKGQLSAEYEYNWKNNASDVATSIKNFRALLSKSKE